MLVGEPDDAACLAYRECQSRGTMGRRLVRFESTYGVARMLAWSLRATAREFSMHLAT